MRKIVAPQLSLAVTPRNVAKTHKLATAIEANTDTVLLTTHNLQALHSGIHTRTGWLPPPERVINGRANIVARTSTCQCGGEVVIIAASKAIAVNEALIISVTGGFGTDATHLVLQFDGS